MMTDPVPAKQTRRRRSITNRLIGGIAWLAVVGLIGELAFSYGLPQRLGDTSSPYIRLVAVAFFGRVFTFHAGLALGMTALLGAALRRWRLSAVAALAAAVALMPTLRGLIPHPAPVAAGRSIRVLSMNTKYNNRDAVNIQAQVRQFNPDVVAVEEFAPTVKETLDAALAGDYPYRCERLNGAIALALYSRLPFDGPAVVSTTANRRQIRAVIHVGGQRVALYVLHPLSPRSIKRIAWTRLSTVDLVQQLAAEKLPVILAGDFNFTAETPNAAALTGLGLVDAFDLAGHGRGSTWPVRPRWKAYLPGVRIDHVYLSPSLTCTHFANGGYMGSDHLPIVADVALAASTPAR